MGITKEQMRDKMKDNKVVVLNVLPESEYLKMHITGSRNQPLKQDHGHFVQEVEKQYGRTHSFITYCSDATCAAGANAAKILRDHGLQADHYPGGTEEWNNAGWPTEGTLVVVDEAVLQKNQFFPLGPKMTSNSGI